MEPNPKPTPWSNIVTQPPPPPPPRQRNGHPAASAADGIFVGNCKMTKGIAVAVVDANAIIQGGEKLHNHADKFVSVSEVIDEVRDPRSRHTLNLLPFSVDTMEASPDSLKKVINFARATGDLQTLSDVDLKLIALTYTLEAQIHGTKHLRDSPPPIHTVNVKRLPEKDLPGWGSNVPNLEEWEALEHANGDGSNPDSRILPLKDLNVISGDEHYSVEDGSQGNGVESNSEVQEAGDGSFNKSREYLPKKKEASIQGKKMVADGIDASLGESNDNADDWLPAVSRSTHRRFLRRKARREMYEATTEKDSQKDAAINMGNDNHEDTGCPDLLMGESCDEAHVENGNFEGSKIPEGKTGERDLATILNQMRLEDALQDGNELRNSPQGPESNNSMEPVDNCGNISDEGDEAEDITSQISESADSSFMDDNSSEQSWMLRSLSDSSVACITSDFAMQNVLLQMGLRLLAPGGMQIRELHSFHCLCPKVEEMPLPRTLFYVKINYHKNSFTPRLKRRVKRKMTYLPEITSFSLQPPVRKALSVFSGRRNPNDNHYSRSKH